jgi:hypothetical protein
MKILTLSLFILTACTSLPKGEPQLKKLMLEDQPRDPQGKISYVHAGRPIYVESYSYPYLLSDGHISMEGKLLVYVGREELSLNELLPVEKELEIHEQENSPIEIKEQPPIIREMGGPRMAESQPQSFPKTPGTETLEAFLQLKDASIQDKDKRVVNHFRCAKPKITKNGDCHELRVEFDLTKCFGSPFVQEGHKVSCSQKEALFGVRLNNVRYRVTTNRLPLPLKDEWNLNSKVQVTFYKP